MFSLTGTVSFSFAVVFALFGLFISIDIPRFIGYSNTSVTVHRDESFDLLIAVISARRNFDQRQAIRDTWMKSVTKTSDLTSVVKILFIVGRPCEVHPSNRLDMYSCQANEWTYLQRTKNIPLVSTITDLDEMKSLKQDIFVTNISLSIKHSLVINSLGLTTTLSLSEQFIKVALYDDFQEAAIASVRFSVHDTGIIMDGYRYQSVQPVLLPEGFQGSLRLLNRNKLILNQSFQEGKYFRKINNYGGSVHLRCIDHDKVVPNIEIHLLLTSMHASIFDDEKFLSRVASRHGLNQLHAKEEENVTRLLTDEMNKFNDTLLVDVVDVYRNLPLKLLNVHKWLNSDAEFISKFILKTDDDCFLNVEEIVSKLRRHVNVEKLWWSNFRDEWFVERYGKWSEQDFMGSTYPRFACGSGNVVSADISQWLALNFAYLKPYQGEDISMGIWLSAVGPNFIFDSSWQCDKSCTNDSLAIPQLMPSELKEMWKSKQKCGNPCGCEYD